MNPARRREGRLADDDVARVSALLEDADSVELKPTVPEDGHRSTGDGAEDGSSDAQIRQVFFFDTPELTLNKHGFVLRARRVQAKGDDSVVELRPRLPPRREPSCRKRGSISVASKRRRRAERSSSLQRGEGECRQSGTAAESALGVNPAEGRPPPRERAVWGLLASDDGAMIG
jgi:hypothetical protein